MIHEISTANRRLMHGLSAMDRLDDGSDEMAEQLGIATELAALRTRQQAELLPRYLYLLRTALSPEERYFKIGTSQQPAIRLRQIATGTGANMPPQWEGEPVLPVALRLGGLALESSIHRDLQPYRMPHTEWFRAVLPVCEYIVAQDAWYNWDGGEPYPI